MVPDTTFRRFADRSTSPLESAVALALGEDESALRTIATAPPGRRGPVAVLAAMHHLALAGAAPRLALAYARGDAGTAGLAARDVLRDNAEAVVSVLVRRPPRTLSSQRCAVLRPALAEVAHRAGADAVGLIDVEPGSGVNLHADRVGVAYDDGLFLGGASSTVRVEAVAVRGHSVPDRVVPPVRARIGLEADPVDPTDPEELRWLHACLPPDRPEAHARLEAEVGLSAAEPPLLLRGDPLDLLVEAVERVPENVLPVVTTTWALSNRSQEDRLRFLRRLDAAATRRTVAWVAVEGVGVAPGLPTLGDRPASGHSLVGLTLLRHASLHAEVVGRCWSRGRMLAWSVQG